MCVCDGTTMGVLVICVFATVLRWCVGDMCVCDGTTMGVLVICVFVTVLRWVCW